MSIRLTRHQGNIEYTHSTSLTLTIKCLACNASTHLTFVANEDVETTATTHAAQHICAKIKRN